MDTPRLFDDSSDAPGPSATAPLAERMRPRSLDDVVGQEALVGPRRAPLRLAIEHDTLQSLILWGPPGTGKTTLARVIADRTEAKFVSFSAVLAGIKDIKDVMARCRRPCDEAPDGPPDDPLRRRDSPLQQGAAGCVSPLRRSRHDHPHRRDDREPVVRSECGAALTVEGLRARAALPRRRRVDPEARVVGFGTRSRT